MWVCEVAMLVLRNRLPLHHVHVYSTQVAHPSRRLQPKWRWNVNSSVHQGRLDRAPSWKLHGLGEMWCPSFNSSSESAYTQACLEAEEEAAAGDA